MILYPASNTVVTHTFGPNVLTGVSVSAKDFNGLSLPISGVSCDTNGEWRATLSIPESAPLCSVDSEYYTLTWVNGSERVIQKFQVVGYDEGTQLPPPAALGIIGLSLRDEVLLPYNTNEATIRVRLINPADSRVLADSDTDGDVVLTYSTGGSRGYAAVLPLSTAAGVQVGEYLLQWDYGLTPSSVATNQVFRQAFVITPNMTMAVNAIRTYIDQANLARWLANANLHDVEILDCMYRAAERVNPAPPQRWTYPPDELLKLVPPLMREATIYEIMSRLAIAEGMKAFDYQGGSISLNVDRTGFLQSRADQASSWLDSNMRPVKAAVARQISPSGRLSITRSSSHNNNFGFSRNGFVPFMLTGVRPVLWSS